ncbi:MAG TPA: PKD domain-containing protein [Marine Group III euryarchaeote]|uniref:PKD domain-containing protein n=1 Tax=Marine Group III euryarchaeote TaxID=2173149 RepID=A0A7C8DFY9_9ARCH|nr:PKD domain-containing protein [Marine Group III euryarchaeote]
MLTRRPEQLLAGILIVTVIAVIAAGYVQGHQDGDLDAGYSSAPGDNDCTSCHSDTGPNDGGSLDVTLSVTEYVPGENVDIDVAVSGGGHDKFGFEMVVINGNGDSVGNFSIEVGDITLVTASDGYDYIMSNSEDDGDESLSWEFAWAPSDHHGDVTFYIASMSCIWLNATQECQVGDEEAWDLSRTLVQQNRAPTLTGGQVSPGESNWPISASDAVGFQVTYTDLDDDAPSEVLLYVDGTGYVMSSSSSNDGDYTNGENYEFAFSQAGDIGLGMHTYHFTSSDGEAGVTSDTYDGPRVNDEPVLSSIAATPSTVQLPINPATVTVTYTDANGQAPSSITLCVGDDDLSDGCSGTEVDMTASAGGDGDYTNGEQYEHSQVFAGGKTVFAASANDSMDASNVETGSVWVRTDVPWLSDASVSPTSGGEDDDFSFSVRYHEYNGTNASTITVTVGSNSFSLSRTNDSESPADAAGAEYAYNGTMAWGTHSVAFDANNGANDAAQLSGSSITVNDAPAFTANGTATRVSDTYTFTASVSDVNEDDGDSLTVWADIADHGILLLASNGDGTYSDSLDLSALINHGGDRTATFGAEDSIGVAATSSAGTASFFVDYVGGADLDDPADTSGAPGDRTITFTITNSGNADDTYTIGASNFASWDLSFPATVDVAYDSSATFDLTLNVPFLAYGVPNQIDVDIASQNDGTATDAHSMIYSVGLVQDVAVTAVSSTQEGAPGSSTIHTFTVQNTGNYDNTFVISTSSSWSSDASSSGMSLDMGEARLVTVTHDVPAGAAHGDSDTVTLNVVGGASGSDSAESSAGLVTGSSITLGTVSAAYPGDSFQISGTVTNTGNGDATYSFGISGNSVANGWAVLNTTSTDILAAGAGFDFRVWINVPEDTPAGGSYSISVTTDDNNSASATIDIASDARSVSVSAAATSFLLNPGSSTETVVTVTNTGNVATDYTIVVTTGHDNLRFSTTSFRIAKGGFQTVQLTVMVPASATAAISAGFTVTPSIDGTGASQSISITPNLLQDTSGWSLSTSGTMAGSMHTFALSGAAAGLTIDWDFGDGASMVVDGGASQDHTYDMAGDYTISLVATDSLGQVTSFSAPVTAANSAPLVPAPSVSEDEGITIDDNTVSVVEEHTVEFVLAVPTDDDGSIAFLVVDFGDGSQISFSGSDLIGQSTLNLNHAYAAPGTYQVQVTAGDNSGAVTTTVAQEVVVAEAQSVMVADNWNRSFIVLVGGLVLGLLMAAAAYNVRTSGFTGESMNKQERARLAEVEQSLETSKGREELLEVAAYDASRVATKLEAHLSAFNEILVKAQQIAATERLAELEAAEAAETAAAEQLELDMADPDMELLAERFHGTLTRLVDTRTELGRIEEQLAYVLKMERDEQFSKLTEITEAYESTKRKIEAIESVRTAREEAREETSLMDLLSGSGAAVSSDDGFGFADDYDDEVGDDEEEYEVEIYEDEDGSFYYIDPDSGEEVPCNEDGNPL